MLGATELAVIIAGALATFFSPCAYALLPGYVGYTVHRTQDGGSRLAFARGLVAGTGVLVTLGILASLFLLIGVQLAASIEFLEPAVGLVIAFFGVLLLVGRAPSLHVALPARPSSLGGFGLFGAGYAVASVGCGLPVFVGVIGTALAAGPTAGALLLGLYVAIIVFLMIAVTVAAGVGAGALLTKISPHTGTLTKLTGVILILAGLGQVWVAVMVSPVSF